MWDCPRWHEVRTQAGAPLGVPPGGPARLAATGVLEAGAGLEATARTLLERHPTPAAGVAAAEAYNDGNAFDGSDPLLARGGWAAVLVGRYGRTIQVHFGPADGPQTAPPRRAPSRSVGAGGLRGRGAHRHRL